MAKTISEDIFDAYLKLRGINFKVELGDQIHPDRHFSVNKQKVICEIRELTPKKDEKVNGVGSFNPYTRLRKVIRKKVRQGSEAKKEKTPYVVVLYNNGSMQLMEGVAILGAMYGDLSFVIDIPKNPREKGKHRGNYFSGNGILRHARSHREPGIPYNKRISAVAVLERINPTQRTFDEAYEENTKDIDNNDLEKLLDRAEEIQQELTKAGRYDPDLRIPRLRIYHNVYAYNPLGFDVFNAENDKQYYIEANTGASTEYSD